MYQSMSKKQSVLIQWNKHLISMACTLLSVSYAMWNFFIDALHLGDITSVNNEVK